MPHAVAQAVVDVGDKRLPTAALSLAYPNDYRGMLSRMMFH